MESEPKRVHVESNFFYLLGRGDCEVSAEAIAEARAEHNRGETLVSPIEGVGVAQWLERCSHKAEMWVQFPPPTIKIANFKL